MSRSTRHGPASRRRASDERGAAAMEMAIVAPLLFMLVFGIIEWGLVFKDTLPITAATRSGARTGTSQPRHPSYHLNTADAVAADVRGTVRSDGLEFLSVYKADPATGKPVSGDFETCSTCYRFDWDPATLKWKLQSGPSWPAASQSACGGVDDTDYLGVYVRYKHSFITGMFGRTITLTDNTVMRLEPIPNTQICKP